ncbi:unnamed protein product [Rangifer tarandus platyrhynchus]|uniref:Uncharacterized protein n=1 Tax=Rangifer tarandus platyrhynchus TaxID=3082113 RepID=A0AC59Z6Z6_RANTA
MATKRVVALDKPSAPHGHPHPPCPPALPFLTPISTLQSRSLGEPRQSGPTGGPFQIHEMRTWEGSSGHGRGLAVCPRDKPPPSGPNSSSVPQGSLSQCLSANSPDGHSPALLRTHPAFCKASSFLHR